MSPYSIRPTRPDDAPHLPAIERAAGQAFLALEAFRWIADDAVLSTQAHLALIRSGHCLVAVEKHDRPIGFLAAGVRHGRLHIHEFAVHHDWQGKGVGSTLLNHLAADARKKGLRQLSLTTFREVPWNRPFYERQGFRVLTPPELPDDLQHLMAQEARHGLEPARRCAMVRDLY
ncbi:GNAT family N-acetyltransferase [Enterobacteriaceae bacterium BIT-l23]|uniref:GNAT family N-acetyltransferase n=1 Tax=Jejubacter sp. L23 TaxID=3092086 RepID=UPI00158563F3|nr:GNAT family N-acetyltransferase [Enterobacteriaceae bacterium BIT-l23]